VIKALRLALLALLRDGKSGELRVLMLALLVAVSALTAVGFFTNRVSLAVDQQAGEVLAADLRLQSRAPIEREYFDLFVGLGRGELLPYASYYLTGFLKNLIGETNVLQDTHCVGPDSDSRTNVEQRWCLFIDVGFETKLP